MDLKTITDRKSYNTFAGKDWPLKYEKVREKEGVR